MGGPHIVQPPMAARHGTAPRRLSRCKWAQPCCDVHLNHGRRCRGEDWEIYTPARNDGNLEGENDAQLVLVDLG